MKVPFLSVLPFYTNFGTLCLYCLYIMKDNVESFTYY